MLSPVKAIPSVPINVAVYSLGSILSIIVFDTEGFAVDLTITIAKEVSPLHDNTPSDEIET